MCCSCREGLKNPPPPPKSKAVPKPRTEPEKMKASDKDGFSRVIQATSRKPVLNVLDTLSPEPRKKTVIPASQSKALGAASSSRVFKPPGRGKNMEIKFSDDNVKGSTVTRGPSTLEIINNIRSPSDFDSDDMDDLIRAVPDSALDADKFTATMDLTADVEEVSSPPDILQTTRKRLRDPPPGPDPTAKRMRRISDWQSDIGQRRFVPVRSDSVQEVGVPSTSSWDAS